MTLYNQLHVQCKQYYFYFTNILIYYTNISKDLLTKPFISYILLWPKIQSNLNNFLFYDPSVFILLMYTFQCDKIILDNAKMAQMYLLVELTLPCSTVSGICFLRFFLFITMITLTTTMTITVPSTLSPPIIMFPLTEISFISQ